MPTSPPRIERPGGEAGFTLVELLVVVVTIGLLSAVAAPRLDRARGFGARARLAASATHVLNEARARAMAGGRTVEIAAAALSEGRRELDLITPDRKSSVRFYADGSSSGATVALRQQPLLTVDWLTGAVAEPAEARARAR